MLSKSFLDMYSGFFGVVVGHGGEEMMRNMRIRDMMVEVVQEETIRAINGQGSTTLEVPDIFPVMRQGRVGVLKIGDENQPKVNKEVRDHIVLDDGQRAKHLTSIDKTTNGDKHAQNRLVDISDLVAVKDIAVRVEVGGPAGVRLASDISEEIQGPAKHKHQEHAVEHGNGAFFQSRVRSISFRVDITGG